MQSGFKKAAVPVGIIFLFIVSACSNQKIIHPQTKDITEAVYASGKVLPVNNYAVFSLVNGTMLQQNVSEGDLLNAGQVMFQIESNDPLSKLSLSKEVYETAEKNYSSESPVLAEWQKKLATAQAKMKQDSLNFFRNKNLFDANAISKNMLEQSQLMYTASGNDYAQLKEAFTKVKQQLFLDMMNAKTQWEIAQNDAGYYNVKSNSDGRVYSIMKKPGEFVHQGEVLAMCGDANNFYVQMLIDEADVRKVKTGQTVWLQVELFGDSLIEGTVLKIFPGIDLQNRTVRVDVGFTHTITGLFANATAEGNIITNKKSKALLIPKNLLLPGDSVLVKRDKTLKVPVKTGIETEEDIEIISGINANENLVTKK